MASQEPTKGVEFSDASLWKTGAGRRQLWEKDLHDLCGNPDALKENALDVGTFVFKTLQVYTDLSSKNLVERWLDKALTNDTFLKTFAGLIVKHGSKTSAPSHCAQLSRWTLLVLQRLDPVTGAKAIPKLVEIMASCLDPLLMKPQWKGVSRKFARLMAGQGLVKEALKVAKSGGSPGLVRALLDLGISSVTDTGPEIREMALTLYCEQVFGGKIRVADDVLWGYTPLVSSLSHKECEDTVIPCVCKSVRRNPEVALMVFSRLLSDTDLDMSRHVGQLLTPLLQFVRHAKEGNREIAVKCVSQLCRRVSDIDSLRNSVETIQAILEGKTEGKVKNVYERASLMNAISGMSYGVGQSTSGVELAKSVASFCCSYYATEVNEEVKLCTLEAVGCWLFKCNAPVASVQDLFSKGFGGKDAIRRGTLRALVQALENPELCSQVGSIVPALISIISSGMTKVTQRTDGLLALLAASWIGAADSSADAILEKEKIWTTVLASDSPYFTPITAGKLTPDESCSLAKLVQCLLTIHSDKLEKNAGSLEITSTLLVFLLLHHSKDVRNAASNAVSRCFGASASLANDFLHSLRKWLADGAQISVLQPPSEEEFLPSSALVAQRFADAVNAVVPTGIDGSVEIATKALLRFHHPTVLNGAKQSWAWGRLKSHHEGLCDALAGNAGTACKILFGEEGMASEDPREVAGAISSISTIMQDVPDSFFPQLLQHLEELLDREEHDNLSEHNLLIFSTPEGVLSAELHDLQVAIPGLDNNKSKPKEKKARGRFKGDKTAFAEPSDSDDESDPRAKAGQGTALRPSQVQVNGPKKGKGTGSRAAGKGGAKDASERQAEMRQRQLQEESQVREEVNAIKKKLEDGLHALAAMTKGNSSYCSDYLDELMGHMPLLTSPLVGEGAAFEYAVGLSSCLPGQLGASCLTVACALRLIMLSECSNDQEIQKKLLEHSSLELTLNAMIDATGKKNSLPAPAYFLCFPVLRAILSSPTITSHHDDALKILSLHVTPGERLPREKSFELLYQVLVAIPTYRAEVQPCLVALCAGLIDSEIVSALQGLLLANPLVRGAALHALPSIPSFAAGVCPEDDELLAILMIGLHDPNEANQEAAVALWDMSGANIPASFVSTIPPYLSSPYADIRQAATEALVEGLETFPDSSGDVLNRCIAVFAGTARVDERLGAAQALGACAEFFDSNGVHLAIDFLLKTGFCDDDAGVREKLVSAGVQLVDIHGKGQIQELYSLLQSHLEKPPKASAAEEARQDKVREGAVLLLATMAKHLLPEDPKIKDIIQKLITILSTPSEAVQKAAAGCLSPLMQVLQGDTAYNEKVIGQLKKQLTKGATYGDRRGAAFGMAGVVKGLGISSLKNYGIINALKEFIEDKSDPKSREGAVQGFECLCDKLGKLFEPYVISILPLILTCFGDTALPVREATVDAARAMMRNLSAQGVKLVLPSLLKGLGDQVWRTKQGSIQLLGAMAWCAPKQLSTCLPTIVPKLSEVLSDPHQKVQKAAQLALNEVGSTIRNPEVQELVPSLLNAIAQPNKYMRECLDQLLQTVFVNTIDAPSLALIIPVVFRGLKDRSGEVKKRAARIVQNLCKLVNNPKDMAPYVKLLVPELQKAIVDPLPDVRAQASKALGAIMRDMGQEALQDVMPWLIDTLKSKGSSVERSGAAQALAEVLAVYGTSYFEDLLPQLLDDCKASSAPVREGGITLFRFLPYTMCDTFQSHLNEVLPCILDGLADENEGVRDASMSAGRTLVDVYAETSMVLILPAVEQGLCNDNWRIRHSSVDLLGSLFYKVAGASGKIQMDGDSDDEGVAVESYSTSIISSLGLERRNDVLAKLYMTRADVQYPVRSAALHVWKTVVVNTPKTLGEILPSLMEHTIETLAHSGEDGREMAGRCIGELVKKMGERVLPTILPILREGTESESPETRQGVCYGLSEVLDNLSRAQLTEHLPMLLPAIQATLCDEDASVREAAAGAFNALFKAGAGGIVDTVIPALLTQLQSDSDNSKALEGLQVILSVRPQTLNSMVPRLLHKPITVTNLKALGAVAAAAGGSLQNHLAEILSTILSIASMQTGKPIVQAAQEAARKVALSVPEEATAVLIAELLKALEDADKGLCAAELVKLLCSDAKLDISEHVASLIQALVPLLASEDELLVKACWTALGAVTSTIPKEMQPSFVRCLRDAVASARDMERRKMTGGPLLIAGFCLPKGLSPVLPIYLQGVLQGSSAELRELAADGLGELVVLTSQQMLKPFVVQITGPLIRIIGDRFPWQIKFAILSTLGLLIEKAGDGLKAFVPQLQTTFLKCLQDPTQGVRDQAAKNLGRLTRMSPRVDQLAADLCSNAVKGDPAVHRSYLAALRGMFQNSGERISPNVLARTGLEIMGMLSNLGEDENDIAAVSSCLGAFTIHCGPEDMRSVLSGPLGPPKGKWNLRLAHSIILASTAKLAHHRLHDLDLSQEFVQGIIQFSKDDKVPVKISACKAAARFIVADMKEGTTEFLPSVVPAIVTCLAPDQSSDLHREGLASLRQVCNSNPRTFQPYFADLVPSLCYLINSAPALLKAMSEKTLAQVLNLNEDDGAVRSYLGSNPGGTVKSVLTEPFLRRLQKLTPEQEEEEEAY